MSNKRSDIDWNDPRLEIAIDNFDIEEFLNEEGIGYALEGKNIGERFIGIEECPSCGKGNYHAAIHKDKKFMSCFVCKCYYNLPKIIALYKKIRIKTAVSMLIESVESGLDVEQRVRQILFFDSFKAKEYVPVLKEELPENKKITKTDLKYNRDLISFFEKRNLKDFHVDWYDLRLGINKYKGKIIFPIKKKGEIVTFQWRDLKKKQYHLGKTMGNYLVEEERILVGKPLIIVEGFLDFVSVDTLIRNRFKEQLSVTTGLVKMLSAVQIQRIIDCRPSFIFSMLDNDSWFEWKRLNNNVPFDVVPIILPKGHDPNSLGSYQLNKLIRNEVI